MPLPTLALGLGELSVHSNLGQPLHVTVELLDPAPELGSDCFRLRPASDGLAMPSQTRLTVEQRAARTLLHITTERAFNEPIAQFVLAAACETSLQREYVLLLDPPAPVESALTPQAAAVADTPAAPIVPAYRARARTNVPATLAAEQEGASRRAEPARASRSRAPEPAMHAAVPRLVISGRHHPADATGTPLAAQNPARVTPGALTSTELSDEHTALLHRIAHMETQLLALQQRNAELEAKLGAGLQATTSAAPAATAAPEWPIYSLALIGLLAGSGALVSWMRRRPAPQRTLMEQMLWTSLKPIRPVIARPHVGPLPPLDTTMPRNDSIMAIRSVPANPPQDADDFPLTAVSDGTEVREDVIDQAEVLVVHGYPRLAIQLLREHLRMDPAESPSPWLLLLDLLHREHDQAGYEQARTECQRHFNVRLPEQPPILPTDPDDGLLAYPHLLDALTRAWNTPGLDALLQDLIYDRRGGVRVGLEPDAYRDILLLRAIAREAALSAAA